jgi:Aminotransferase class I and II
MAATISIDGGRVGVVLHRDIRVAVRGRSLDPAVAAVERHGAGAGGTRNISGTHHRIIELEAELADLHRKEAALVFTSGWLSNLASISTIASLLPNCLILSDALNHNSMIEGIRRSGCEKKIWRHNDVAHLEQLLLEAGRDRMKLIVFESLYSMDGDIGPRDRGTGRATQCAHLYRRGSRGWPVRPRGGLAEREGLLDRISVIEPRSPKDSARLADTLPPTLQSSMRCGAMRSNSFSRPPCRPWLPPARARRSAT